MKLTKRYAKPNNTVSAYVTCPCYVTCSCNDFDIPGSTSMSNRQISSMKTLQDKQYN